MLNRGTSRKLYWAGWALTILPCLLLFMSAAMKFARPPQVLEGFNKMGIPERLSVGIGIVEVVCAILYLIPQTAVIGAILLTGYLGGAILTHLRIGDSIVMPILLGIIIWGGLYLRDPRIRSLIPLRR